MVQYRRNRVPGATYFFTVTLQDRTSDALTRHAGALRQAFRKAQAERPFAIDAIVVLPEHLHTVLTLPECDGDYPHRWRRIKTLFTQSLLNTGVALAQRDTTGRALWQRRYWEHTIRDEADYMRHVDYIHYNPVKHGLVAHAEDWPFSSLHGYIRQGVLPAGWASEMTDAQGFRE